MATINFVTGGSVYQDGDLIREITDGATIEKIDDNSFYILSDETVNKYYLDAHTYQIDGVVFNGTVEEIVAAMADIFTGGSGVSEIDTTLNYVNDVLGVSPIGQSMMLAAYQALGSNIKTETVGVSVCQMRNLVSLQDGRTYLMAGYNPLSQLIAGVKFFQGAQGSFTGDNFNGIGLYTYLNGTLTQVAVTSNDANIWKGAANTWQTVAFTTPYTLQKGIYYIEALYNNSAQTTAPSIGAGDSLAQGNIALGDFTNTAKLYAAMTGQTALNASHSITSTPFATGDRLGFFLY